MKMITRSIAAGLGLAMSLGAISSFAQESGHLNRTIETVSADKPVFGLFTGNFSAANARALARSNLDFLFIDMEHTALDMETLQAFLLGLTDKETIAKTGNAQMPVTPIVRIPQSGNENFQWQVKQVLDLGAFGIVFPNVETPEMAELAIRAMRYPQVRGDAAIEPAGLRGASPAVATWYWGTPDYMNRADVWPLDPKGDLLAVLQIESPEGVENVEKIAAVPGVGAIFIGPFDLSVAMGVPGQLNDPQVAAAMKRVLAACKANDVPCGLTTNEATVADYLDEGYDFVTVGYWGDAGISGGTERALRIAREHSGRN